MGSAAQGGRRSSRLLPRPLLETADALHGALDVFVGAGVGSKPMERRILRVRRIGVRLSVVSLVAATVIAYAAAVVVVPSASAQPDDRWPCVGQVDFTQLGKDPRLTLTPQAAVVPRPAAPASGSAAQAIDAVQLTWDLPNVEGGVKCIWIGVQLPGTSYFTAEHILRPSETPDMKSIAIEPSGNAGTYCYRIVALSGTARGEFADRCVEIKSPRVPPPPDDAPLPPNAGSGSTGVGTRSPWSEAQCCRCSESSSLPLRC